MKNKSKLIIKEKICKLLKKIYKLIGKEKMCELFKEIYNLIEKEIYKIKEAKIKIKRIRSEIEKNNL